MSDEAITENITFSARVASFYPLDYKELRSEFEAWLRSKQDDHHMLIFQTEISYRSRGEK